jgi:betaine-aldehyde dehydrogenase
MTKVVHILTLFFMGALAMNAHAENYKMYINGEFVDSESGRMRDILDPANQELIAKVPEGTRGDAQRAIRAARDAFDIEKGDQKRVSWRWMDHKTRGAYLKKIAAELYGRADELARLEVRNNGKILAEAKGDILATAELFEQYANWAGTVCGKIIPVGNNDLHCSTVYEPIGVCAGITPWNYPLYIAAWKIAPAIATGNTVVLKPSELTPLTTLELAKIFYKVGLPPGVVNIVTGTGVEVGAELSSNPQVDKIAFTGGTETGRLIAVAAAQTFKKCSLELGGKSAQIVFADADLEKAVDGAILGIFTNQGEVCSAGSRLLLEKSIHDRFVSRLMERIQEKGIRLGHGLEEASKMGPLISKGHREKVLGHIAQGIRDGAILLIGGGIPKDERLVAGFFVEPTVFDHVTPKMALATEEIFGPVLSILTFEPGATATETEANAIRMANDSVYGLAAGVWTQSGSRAQRVTPQLNVGIVWVNTFDLTLNELPWGGRKKSGYGRELGLEGLLEYLEPKQVIQNIAE